MKLSFFKKPKDTEMAGMAASEIGLEDIIAPSGIEVKQNFLKLGERLCKTFFVFSYPRYLTTGWLSPVINLNCPLDVALHIHPIDSGAILRRLRKKITEVQAELAEREEKGLVRDPALETAYQDIETLRDELQTARERIFRLGVYITTYGDSEKELRETETILRSILESRLIYLKPALLREKEGFVSTVPYCLDKIMVHTPMNTAPLSSIFPFVSPDLSANEGILYGINQHNNSLVLFDRFALENANMVCFAKSGAGKSLDKNTKVLCRANGSVRLEKIGNLVEKILREQGIDFYDEELEGKRFPGFKVWTFDENLKGRWGEVKIAARKLAPRVFYRFRTQSGREITTTGDHNLVALKNGRVKTIRGDEVEIGEYIPLPRAAEISNQDKDAYVAIGSFAGLAKELRARAIKPKKKNVLPFIFNSSKEQVAQYLSVYFEKRGGVDTSKAAVVARSKSKQLISEISYLLYFFGIIAWIRKPKKKPAGCLRKERGGYWTLTILGRDNLKRFAEHIGFISNKKRKALHKVIQKTNNRNIDSIPGATSILKEIYELFGHRPHCLRGIPKTKRRPGALSPIKLKKMIGIIEECVQRLKTQTPDKSLSKSKTLPWDEAFDSGENNQGLSSELWRVLGRSWRIANYRGIKPGLINPFVKMAQVVSGRRHRLVNAKPFWRGGWKAFEHNIPKIEEKLKQLKVLANSDLFWDKIVEIKRIENKKDKYVYDLTCENSVFLAGEGGMFAHNSYFVKVEILRYLMQGVPCIIIDPENEYEFLSDTVGGSFFNFSLTSPHHLNPFALPIPREDENPADLLRSNVINLVGLFRLMLGGLTPQEDAIIDQALTETYAAKDITPDSDPAGWKERLPLMSDLEDVLAGMVGTDSLIERVRKFTKGSYAQFFNQPSNISMDNDFMVFGIRDMEEELRPMAMFVILRCIWNAIRSSLKKRILLVDEAWWLMKNEDGASFLFGLCKWARKYWLGVTTITQDVSDFMKSEYGKPIITNSSLQFLMKQSPAAIDVVQKTFYLTEEEKNLLLGCDVGEGIFIAGQKRVAMRVVASYTEDQIITASPEEIKKIREAKRQLVQ